MPRNAATSGSRLKVDRQAAEECSQAARKLKWKRKLSPSARRFWALCSYLRFAGTHDFGHLSLVQNFVVRTVRFPLVHNLSPREYTNGIVKRSSSWLDEPDGMRTAAAKLSRTTRDRDVSLLVSPKALQDDMDRQINQDGTRAAATHPHLGAMDSGNHQENTA
jgi:hypothetical protein